MKRMGAILGALVRNQLPLAVESDDKRSPLVKPQEDMIVASFGQELIEGGALHGECEVSVIGGRSNTMFHSYGGRQTDVLQQLKAHADLPAPVRRLDVVELRHSKIMASFRRSDVAPSSALLEPSDKSVLFHQLAPVTAVKTRFERHCRPPLECKAHLDVETVRGDAQVLVHHRCNVFHNRFVLFAADCTDGGDLRVGRRVEGAAKDEVLVQVQDDAEVLRGRKVVKFNKRREHEK